MKATKALARAAKYYLILEENMNNAEAFEEDHKNFVEKLDAYKTEENITEEEAQENILAVVEFLKDH